MNPHDTPPPLPPRPQSRYPTRPAYPRNTYGHDGGMYGGAGLNYGMYGATSYGSPNPPYMNYAYGSREFDTEAPEFVQFAEENTRPAFETIQSIVHGLSSVSMMFESTYHALHSSFRAILSVIEQFTKIKLRLTDILSALSLVKFLKRMHNEIFGDGSVPLEAGWDEGSGSGGKPINWPILLYLGLVLGSPYLVWKMLKKYTQPSPTRAAASSPDWRRGLTEHYVGQGKFAFQARGTEELSIAQGEEIRIAPKNQQPSSPGWLLAANQSGVSGLVPANYIQVRGQRRPQSPLPATQPDLVQRESRLDMPECDLDKVWN